MEAVKYNWLTFGGCGAVTRGCLGLGEGLGLESIRKVDAEGVAEAIKSLSLDALPPIGAWMTVKATRFPPAK